MTCNEYHSINTQETDSVTRQESTATYRSPYLLYVLFTLFHLVHTLIVLHLRDVCGHICWQLMHAARMHGPACTQTTSSLHTCTSQQNPAMCARQTWSWLPDQSIDSSKTSSGLHVSSVILNTAAHTKEAIQGDTQDCMY